MILILGSTHDDVLYYETQLKNKEDRNLGKNVKLIFGEIYNQKILLAYNVKGNYMSSAVTSYLIAKHDIIMVFVVGTCFAYSDGIRKGDIAMCDTLLLSDVDLSLTNKVRIGEIPGFNKVYASNRHFFEKSNEFAKNFVISNIIPATFVSSNSEYRSIDEIAEKNDRRTVLGASKNLVYDSSTGGSAFSCALFDIPFLSFKVVLGKIKNKVTTEEKIVALKEYADIGKVITAIIGEIGRNDTISVNTLIDD